MKNKDNFQKFEEWVLNYFIFDCYDPSRHRYWNGRPILFRFITRFLLICFVLWIGIITLMACVGGSQASIRVDADYINGTMTEQSYVTFKNIVEPTMIMVVNSSQYIALTVVLLYISFVIYFIIRWECRKKKDEL